MDYEDYIKLTPEQTQDWYRENKRDTQRLGEEITQFLRWLCERNSTGEYRDHNGMWNCQSWLLPALSKNGITHKHMQARGHLAETVTFEVNDATLSIAEYDVSLHTMHHEETEDNEEEDDAPTFWVLCWNSTSTEARPARTSAWACAGSPMTMKRPARA